MLFGQMLKGKKFKIFLGIDFFCVKINLSHKQSHRVTDDLRCITYYIIYTLTRIENVLIYVAHAYMHCGWTIYYSGSGQGLIWKIWRINSQLSSKSEKFTVTSFP